MIISLPEEEEYLQGVEEELKRQADRLMSQIYDLADDYREKARYLWEQQSEFDGYELIFNRLDIDRTVDAGEKTKEQFHRMLKMMDSPYFARIDFTAEGENTPMKVYIGKFAFWNMTSEYEVFDWRAPIAGMYYEFEYGDAYYEAPAGKVFGMVDCKRQYGIRHGSLEYALESSLRIEDELLKRELSKSSDHKMRDIVATIQKEQNRLVRNETAEVLIVQGVAGSGKTSIALHRIAYFLYRYRNEITADNFLIISPNGIFVDYISGVLPELGEENIKNIGAQDIAAAYLRGDLRTENLSLQAERFLEKKDEDWQERNRFKATSEFVRRLEEYIEYCDRCYFTVRDYAYEGGCIDSEFICRHYERRIALPVHTRLKEIADAMKEELRTRKSLGGYGTHKREIEEWLFSLYSHNDALSLYRAFYEWLEHKELFVLEEGGELEAADIYPLLYLKLYLEGSSKNEAIKYLIVDEMQDYTPIQYAVFNKLYPCKKTILGDFSQNVVPFVQTSLSFLEELYPTAQVMEIHKSYRSTKEIMEFAGKIRKDIIIETVDRHGDKPLLLFCRNKEEERARILELLKVDEALGGEGKRCILCKSHEQAKDWYRWLQEHVKEPEKLHLLDHDSEEFYNGTMISAISMAKGLEFDEVLIPDADDEQYCSEYDRGLLYVACTRAMHRLTLLYCGQPSRLLS